MYALTIFYIFVSVHYVQLCVQWGNILYFTTEQSQSKVEAKVGSGSLKNPKAEQLQMSRIDHTVNCYIKVVAHFFLKIVCNNTVIHLAGFLHISTSCLCLSLILGEIFLQCFCTHPPPPHLPPPQHAQTATRQIEKLMVYCQDV